MSILIKLLSWLIKGVTFSSGNPKKISKYYVRKTGYKKIRKWFK
jgi:hypothetical protein